MKTKGTARTLNRTGKWLLRHISIGLNRFVFRERHTICYSSYIHRNTKIGGLFYRLINAWVFWERDHCRRSYLLEKQSKLTRKR